MRKKKLTQIVVETWYTDVTSPEADKKKAIKSGGHHARFHITMLTNTAIEDPLEKTAQPNPRQKGEIFSMMHDVSHRI